MEQGLISAVREIVTSQISYSMTIGQGSYAPSLKELQDEELINDRLGSGTRDGYTFRMTAGPTDEEGKITTFRSRQEALSPTNYRMGTTLYRPLSFVSQIEQYFHQKFDDFQATILKVRIFPNQILPLQRRYIQFLKSHTICSLHCAGMRSVMSFTAPRRCRHETRCSLHAQQARCV